MVHETELLFEIRAKPLPRASIVTLWICGIVGLMTMVVAIASGQWLVALSLTLLGLVPRVLRRQRRVRVKATRTGWWSTTAKGRRRPSDVGISPSSESRPRRSE